MSTLTPDGIADFAPAIRAGDRAALARAITLVESRREDHAKAAHRLVQELLPRTGKALRIGITGAPGVGKSTLIDTLGTHLTAQGRKVAVLAVDPSSTQTGGSILGDKTRMTRLANDPNAFVRPSPSAGTLGGVAARSRETLLLCEAAGFDVVLVETVGIGQSETTVAGMTDFFLLLMLPGAGDELQGIKKGVVELADMIAVNKADGDNLPRATSAAASYSGALHILTPRSTHWTPPVVTVSGLTGDGIVAAWETIEKHRAVMMQAGEHAARRRTQQVRWMWDLLEARLRTRLRNNAAMKEMLPRLESEVAAGRLSPMLAVEQITAALN
jgi:LAO/AO transport system kinase